MLDFYFPSEREQKCNKALHAWPAAAGSSRVDLSVFRERLGGDSVIAAGRGR